MILIVETPIVIICHSHRDFFCYQRRHLKRVDKYKHIVNVETTKAASSQREVRSETIANGSETTDIEGELIICFLKLIKKKNIALSITPMVFLMF